MSASGDVLLWAQRIVANKARPAHELLEVRPQATPEQVQAAFHKIARTAHPDLHRLALSADDLEVLTSAYAVVAGAYQTMRTQTMQTTPMRKLSNAPAPPSAAPAATAPAGGNAAQNMSPKALIYFRKAEMSLRRGDLKGAILQLKLACAADPTSSFLRTALAEVETEVLKAP